MRKKEILEIRIIPGVWGMDKMILFSSFKSLIKFINKFEKQLENYASINLVIKNQSNGNWLLILTH